MTFGLFPGEHTSKNPLEKSTKIGVLKASEFHTTNNHFENDTAKILDWCTFLKNSLINNDYLFLFIGLSISEAAKIGNYFHYRPAEQLENKSLLQKAELDKSIDFLDGIDADIPQGMKSTLQR